MAAPFVIGADRPIYRLVARPDHPGGDVGEIRLRGKAIGVWRRERGDIHFIARGRLLKVDEWAVIDVWVNNRRMAFAEPTVGAALMALDVALKEPNRIAVKDAAREAA